MRGGKRWDKRGSARVARALRGAGLICVAGVADLFGQRQHGAARKGHIVIVEVTGRNGTPRGAAPALHWRSRSRPPLGGTGGACRA